MKVLHIETGRHLYGGALQVFYLMRGLKERGVENLLACVSDSEIGRRSVDVATVHHLRMSGDVDPRFYFDLVKLIQSEKPDVVHIHSRRGADWWGGLAARRCKVKGVLTRRVDNPESAWLAKIKYSRYDRIVTISDGIRQVLLKEGIAPARIQLIHSVVDRSRYGGPGDPEWFRREFSIKPGEIVIAVIAQLIERKGHRFLIEGIPQILSMVPQARFLFFGQGGLRQNLEEQCRALGVENVVQFAGFRDDLERVLPNLDLVVHPALMEGLGVSLLQAAAAGVPIVGAAAGGIPEVVRHARNGYLVPPGDAIALRERVIELLLNGELRRQMGEEGRKLVAEEFSVETMVQRYCELYEQLLV